MGLLRKALKLHAYEWADLARAAAELAIARVRLGSESVEDLLLRPAAEGTTVILPPDSAKLPQRVANAIARAGSRVPWRSDCLVQALAARRWLAREGLRSDLFVGVRGTTSNAVEAHAWLKCGDRVVTGGDVSGFTPLVTPEVIAALKHESAV